MGHLEGQANLQKAFGHNSSYPFSLFFKSTYQLHQYAFAPAGLSMAVMPSAWPAAFSQCEVHALVGRQLGLERFPKEFGNRRRLTAQQLVLVSDARLPGVPKMFTSYHAIRRHQINAESGIGTASRAAPECIKVALPATMRHSGVKWKRSLA